jgi:hypothetical protein
MRLTLETPRCGYDVKDQGQEAESYANRRDVIIAVLCGHALAVHTLTQRFPFLRNTLLGYRRSQYELLGRECAPTLDSYVSACIVELTGRDTKIVNTLEDKVSGPRSTEVA